MAGMLRKGSAGSNTAADHLAVLDAAIAALPPPGWQKIKSCPALGVRVRACDLA